MVDDSVTLDTSSDISKCCADAVGIDAVAEVGFIVDTSLLSDGTCVVRRSPLTTSLMISSNPRCSTKGLQTVEV